MTATDELRRMLDERGVEWQATRAPLRTTSWHGGYGFRFAAIEPYGKTDFLLVQTDTLEEWPHLTPAQAIAATLGDEGVGRSNDGVAELEAGTCHMEFVAIDAAVGYPNLFLCSECEQFAWVKAPNTLCYCPNCGRKVVDDG